MNERIKHLIQLLASDDFETCMGAARDLAALGPISIGPAIDALKKPETGFGAIQTLALIGEPAIAPLIELLRDTSLDVFAAEALRKIGDTAVPALIDALTNEDDSLRFWASGILGWLKDPRAIEALKVVAKDEVVDVRNSAIRALREFESTE